MSTLSSTFRGHDGMHSEKSAISLSSPGDSHIFYNDHLRLLSPEPFGWLAPPKSTRAWEPTLLWNHCTNYLAIASSMARKSPFSFCRSRTSHCPCTKPRHLE